MNKIGIIQGRLSARPWPKLQEFPWDTWEKEFLYAVEIGYDFIEWIFEETGYEVNPIWTMEGRKRIKKVTEETGVPVGSVCADYFLEKPFYRRKGYSLKEHIGMLKELIQKTAETGADTILLPVLENAEIRCDEDTAILTEAVGSVIPTLEACGVYLGFETELPAHRYLELVTAFGSPYVGAYYDAGNCAFCGHDMRDDMEVLKGHVLNIHVKDRKRGGESVPLGTGDTNFAEGIPFLMGNGFTGNFVMQTWFGEDHLGEAKKNLRYIKKLSGDL